MELYQKQLFEQVFTECDLFILCAIESQLSGKKHPQRRPGEEMEAIHESASARRENSHSLPFAPEDWMIQGVLGVLYCVFGRCVCVCAQGSWGSRCVRATATVYAYTITHEQQYFNASQSNLHNISRRCIKNLDCSCLRALLEWGKGEGI